MGKPKCIFYTHSDYSDVWPILFGQCNKYLKDFSKVLFTDQGSPPTDWEVVCYDNSLKYQERVASCLKSLDLNETIIFHHEDMFLYDSINESKLTYLTNLVEGGFCDFVKLISVGDNLDRSQPLISLPKSLVYTIQPTITKVKKLLNVYENTPGGSIWEFEANTEIAVNKFEYIGGMATSPEDKKRGLYHYDSSIYPYVATAVVKGKWNISEYPELVPLLTAYNIPIEQRGTR